MKGPNVVVKGPPWLPSVEGHTACRDVVNSACARTGSCESCSTFNVADVDHIKSMGWNTIRLGVMWAGAQPRDEDALDPDFLRRLDAVLDLTDRAGIHVLLDNHGDEVASAGCGNGAPMWFAKKAAPGLIGRPLETALATLNISDEVAVTKVGGYEHCGTNATKWAQHAGHPNYNILNECCLAMNGRNPVGLGYTTINQKIMDYTIEDGPGRADFVRYWRLMAKAVAKHPSAFGAELMNEPLTVKRRHYMATWRACAEAINAVIPDMSVSIEDVGAGAIDPSFAMNVSGSEFLWAIDPDTEKWIEQADTVFY
eukprot:gene2874-12398_t